MTHPRKNLAAVLFLSTAIVSTPFAVGLVRSGSALAATSAETMTRDHPGSFAQLVKNVQPAVVTVMVTQVRKAAEGWSSMNVPGGESPFGDFFRQFQQNPFGNAPGGQQGPFGQGQGQAPSQELKGIGSGFIIDPSGLIVTNNHVAGDATELRVTLNDGTELPATLVGRDEKTDLAVIKVDAGHPLPAVNWGDSDQAEVGDWVVAIGDPFGIGESVSAGIISARSRDLHSGPYDDYIQIDAAINRGNSGGPLFNEDGQVVGVNSAILSPNGGNIGLGFAIPSNLAKDIVARLEKDGTIERGYLGVQIQPVNGDIAEALGLNGKDGALVADVTPASPAAEAGIKVGDVITSFGDTDVTGPHDLSRIVANAGIGDQEKIALYRDGKETTVTATVGRMPNEQEVAVDNSAGSEDHGQARLGLALTDLTPQIRSELNVAANENGAVVADVKPDSAAAEAGLQRGDIVVAVGSQPVASASEAVTALRKAVDDGKGKVLVLVEHQGHRMYVTLDHKAA